MLDAYIEDYLKESFNRGLGKASESISDITGSEVEIKFTVPKMNLLSLGEFKNAMSLSEKLCGITQRFQGDLDGTAVLFFSPAIGKKLIRILLDYDIPIEYITDIESDALSEIGSVLVNYNLKAIVDDLGLGFKTFTPQFSHKQAFQYFSPEEFNHEKQVIKLEMNLSHGNDSQLGKICLILYFSNFIEMFSSIDSYMKDLLGEAS